MKSVIFLITMSLSSYASAVQLKCDVKNDFNPSSWPADEVLVEFDQSQITTIHYVMKVPEEGGVFRDKVELLYSRTVSNPSVRGSRDVSYCNPDQNEVRIYSGALTIYSECTLKEMDGKVFFDFDLNAIGRDGSFSIFTMTSIGSLERKGVFSSCR